MSYSKTTSFIMVLRTTDFQIKVFIHPLRALVSNQWILVCFWTFWMNIVDILFVIFSHFTWFTFFLWETLAITWFLKYTASSKQSVNKLLQQQQQQNILQTEPMKPPRPACFGTSFGLYWKIILFVNRYPKLEQLKRQTKVFPFHLNNQNEQQE